MARPKFQARLDEAVERAVDVGIDAVFDRVTDFFQRSVDQQRAAMAALPPEARRAVYKCAGCHKMFPFEQMEMVSTKGDGFGSCKRCFSFMWHAGDEKMKALKAGVGEWAKQAARASYDRHAATSVPRGPTPWEVLGVSEDASVEEIKKAYRRHAVLSHPDHVPPGAPPEEREAARTRFEAVDRAYKTIMKVRSAPT